MRGARVLAGRYQLRERIGAGGMGEVWRATDDVLGRTVAVKLILPALVDDPGFVRRFLAEARAMASVRHSGVVAIHDFHADRAGAYLVMEFADGEPMSKVIERVGRLGAAATMDLVRQVALALQAVHDRGIVHRDVKPANLLLRTDGTVALADFGIALGLENTSLTRTGAVIGTPLYLAPEQVMGQPASPRSDVYALGVVAYECLTGRPPFVGDNPFAVAMQRVGRPPPPLGADVPPAVAGVVERALAADPAHRWPSAAEFASAAERATVSLPPGRHAVDWPLATTVPNHHGALAALQLGAQGAGPRPTRRRSRGAAVAVVALVLALLGGIAAGVAIWRSDRGGTERPGAAGDPGPTGDPGQTGNQGPAGDQGAGDAGVTSVTAGPDGKPVPSGFVACGDELLCPAEPMCWRGLVQQGDIALSPGRAECTEPHFWETFAAVHLPAGATTDYDLSHLMERSDVVAICSAGRLAERSRDPAHTPDWRIDAWPIPANSYTVLVHCLAGSPEGETPGAVFRSG